MSIDFWTIGFEAVNFLVLVWLLERLLYRPVLGVIGRRQAEVEQLQAADENAHQALAAERERLAREHQLLADERAQALEAAHTQAVEERARVASEAHAEMERLLAAGRARLEHERVEAARALRSKSVEVGVGIARGLLALSTPADGGGRFVDAVCEQLQQLDDSERCKLAASLDERAVVHVVSAEELDSQSQNECRERISTVLERAVNTSFAVDGSLIAGIEVHFPGLVLRHCWRDALAAVERSLLDEAEHGPLQGVGDDRDTR